jgi:hypothetical protein
MIIMIMHDKHDMIIMMMHDDLPVSEVRADPRVCGCAKHRTKYKRLSYRPFLAEYINSKL